MARNICFSNKMDKESSNITYTYLILVLFLPTRKSKEQTEFGIFWWVDLSHFNTTWKLSLSGGEARRCLCDGSGVLRFKTTWMDTYRTTKLHKRLLKMEFSLAASRSLNFIPSLKIVWLCRQGRCSALFEDCFIFILCGEKSFGNIRTLTSGTRSKNRV